MAGESSSLCLRNNGGISQGGTCEGGDTHPGSRPAHRFPFEAPANVELTIRDDGGQNLLYVYVGLIHKRFTAPEPSANFPTFTPWKA